MIEGHRVDDHVIAQIISIRRIVSMPRDDVEWRKVLETTIYPFIFASENHLFRLEPMSLIFVEDCEFRIDVLEPGHRSFEVARICETVGS